MSVRCPYCGKVFNTRQERIVGKIGSLSPSDMTSHTNIVDAEAKKRAIQEFLNTERNRTIGPYMGYSNMVAHNEPERVWGAQAEAEKEAQRKAGFV